ncbi:hypothetical protein HPP92_017154 [Vanilla planifolia]|uniref:Photosystem I reaction center subunit III n=1 Tax=Vanilla planifolia TaxID=51239 RepID=A0A835Q7I2_VANPL|nr:hypothetical protein HPP92_017154 [Vanilla planifolia]
MPQTPRNRVTLEEEREARATEYEIMAASLTSITSTALTRPFPLPQAQTPILPLETSVVHLLLLLKVTKQNSCSQDLKTFSTALALSSILLVLCCYLPPRRRQYLWPHPLQRIQGVRQARKRSLKKLESALNNYDPDSAPALAIKATIEKTKRRFDNYNKFGLLCGSDGLPTSSSVATSDTGVNSSSGLIFLYIAGWIGGSAAATS